MRNAPSMTSLRALDAVLRHGSLSTAARELCVTPAAISHRLRDLESTCGQPLVVRRNGRFVATALGREISVTLGDAFARICRADDLLQRASAQIVHVTAPYSFATLWLAGHLHEFEALHPDADLRILPSHDPLQELPADIVIVHSDRRPEGNWKLLFRDVCAVMARPGHPAIQSPPADLNEILTGPLVHVGVQHGSTHGAFTWQRWREVMGLQAGAPATGAHLTAEHLAMDFLQRKNVLGLISLINAADHVERGSLVVLPGTRVQSDCSYWIKAPPRNEAAESVSVRFSDWLHRNLARDG